MVIKIVATTGRARGQAVEIRAAKYFIGRHDNCQLRPDLPNLAGIHALIEKRDDHLYLRDFGGEGGTGINDRVIRSREIEIFDDDLIQVGPMVLTLSVKSREDDHRNSLREAPPGWPFLEDDDHESVLAPSPVEPAHHQPERAAGPHSSPSPAVADRVRQPVFAARAAVAMESPGPVLSGSSLPAVAPTRPGLARPIVARSRALRAIASEMIDGVMVLTLLSPGLDEEETVSPVRYELRTLLDEEAVPDRTVIDLGCTQFLSSRAVGVLLAHYQALERRGAAMRVCRVGPQIQPVIDQMRLSMLVDLFDTLEAAIETPWD